MNDQPQYGVIRGKQPGRPHYVYKVNSLEHVDSYRSSAAAHHSANMLNRGVASIDPRAIVGCKVVAR